MTDLTQYCPLGRSGLVVSPLALGTMTFGTNRWGADAATSRAIFDAFLNSGGNFIDTADVYSSGKSEALLGSFIHDAGLRDRIVLATKAGFTSERGHPHLGGNGAKHIHAALDGSLKRLQTDHVDLFWIHIWDQVTPVDEVLNTLTDLVRVGKTRYYGLSNVPAWYAASMVTSARARGLPQPIALQFEYSLVERGIEYEHVALANEFGMSIVPWSPLAGGFLTGKYQRDERASADSRLAGPNPLGDSKFTERNWAILEALKSVAAELGATPASIALAWVTGRPGVASTLIGASRVDQITENVTALKVPLSSEQRARLNKASEPMNLSPFSLYSDQIRQMVFGGQQVALRGKS